MELNFKNDTFPYREKSFYGNDITKESTYTKVIINSEKELKTTRLVGKPLKPEHKKSSFDIPNMTYIFDVDVEQFNKEYKEVNPSACKPEPSTKTYAKV